MKLEDFGIDPATVEVHHGVSLGEVKRFLEEFKDPTYWEVVHGDVFSVDNMTDEEIRQAILTDLIHLHIAEYPITWMKLLRFIPSVEEVKCYQRREAKNRIDRVLNALVHPDVYNLIEINQDDKIKIIPDRDILQAAMDYAGCWLDGFDPPEGVEVLCLSPKAKEDIERNGIDNVIESLAMDFEAYLKSGSSKAGNC